MEVSPHLPTGSGALLAKTLFELRNAWRTRQRHSALKLAFIGAFMLGFTSGLWALFVDGFRFLDTLGGVGLLVVNRLFALFFFALGCMLVLSAILSAYSAFYRSRETDFLLTLPLPRISLFAYKLAQASLLASWAFFFIIIPFVGAYASHERLSWAFSFWTLFFSLPFVVLCTSVGAIAALLAAVLLPRRRMRISLALALLLALALGMWIYVAPALRVDSETTVFLSRLIPGLRLAAHPLMPSWWISEGIMSMTRASYRRGLLFWMVLSSNAAVCVHLYLLLARRLFVPGLHRIRSGAGVTRRCSVLFPHLDSLLGRFLPHDVRSIIVKDIRCFVRDPAQWGQSLFFFGLLALYFLNLRNLHYHTLPVRFRNLIVFLNVFSIATVMASFASRFIYPQLSLEGQSFWVIGMAPSSFRRILLAKFVLWSSSAVGLALGLMAVSVKMLGVRGSAATTSLVSAAACGWAMAAMATGLGALFMDLRQSNPTAIVSGFGGTVTLLLCLAFIALAVFPFGFIYHFFGGTGPDSPALQHALRIALLWLAAITLVATVLPLAAGSRALSRREY